MIGVFRYVHITPSLLTITIILKILYAHTCNPIGFFPVDFLQKIVFKHKDGISKIILQDDCIEIETDVTLKFFIKKSECL